MGTILNWNERLLARSALPAVALSAAFVIAIIGPAGAGAGTEGSPEARAACTPDAMRVCSDFIPDAEKVKHCMIAKRSQLSLECRQAMAAEHLKYRHKRRRSCPDNYCG